MRRNECNLQNGKREMTLADSDTWHVAFSFLTCLYSLRTPRLCVRHLIYI